MKVEKSWRMGLQADLIFAGHETAFIEFEFGFITSRKLGRWVDRTAQHVSENDEVQEVSMLQVSA